MSFHGTPAEKRLERACRYVSDLWFPANPALVERIRVTLQSEVTHDLMDQLLLHIKGDFSLYTYCLKELLQLLSEEGVKPPETTSPLELLRWAGLDRLRHILEGGDAPISRHLFDSMNDMQRERIEDAIVSASAAQKLAEAAKLDSEAGYSTALLRQLGHTLIAWNYPNVYQEALSRLKEGVTIDTAIAQILGFSPSSLAMALAQRWHIPAEMYVAMECDTFQDDEDIDIKIEAEAIGQSLGRLCIIGEALARANRPEIYPSARADWETARREIEARLGSGGLRLIQEAVLENAQSYLMTNPELFRGGLILDPEQHLAAQERSALVSRNPYIERCRPYTRTKLLQAYDLISQPDSLQSALKLLTRDIIPAAGFTGGVIFTIDPASSQLIPQLRIGNPVLRGMDPIVVTSENVSDMVVSAWFAEQPVIVESETPEGVRISALACVYGYSQRYGIIYLEIPRLVLAGSEDYNLIHLKAFAATLSDCFQFGA